jgi:uncharacterized membrane protein YjjP (DUF1212 family)
MEQSSKTLKVLLGILLTILIATVTYVFLTQRGKMSSQTTTTVAPAPNPTQTNITPQASTATIPLEGAQTQVKAIQDQVNAGTLSPEEAKKKLEALSSQVAPPTIPADVLKKMEAQKTK